MQHGVHDLLKPLHGCGIVHDLCRQFLTVDFAVDGRAGKRGLNHRGRLSFIDCVNGRVRINLPLGTALTDRAVLPAGARRRLDDPYSDDSSRRRTRLLWATALLAALALAAARHLGAWPFGPPFWR